MAKLIWLKLFAARGFPALPPIESLSGYRNSKRVNPSSSGSKEVPATLRKASASKFRAWQPSKFLEAKWQPDWQPPEVTKSDLK
ncbi:MAG: hypothetical protein JNM39_04320 [Bdellovibrionaceae bacterium]|nr:hypothetical protein [Pseudobdellovibrionaceae bacterium]